MLPSKPSDSKTFSILTMDNTHTKNMNFNCKTLCFKGWSLGDIAEKNYDGICMNRFWTYWSWATIFVYHEPDRQSCTRRFVFYCCKWILHIVVVQMILLHKRVWPSCSISLSLEHFNQIGETEAREWALRVCHAWSC